LESESTSPIYDAMTERHLKKRESIRFQHGPTPHGLDYSIEIWRKPEERKGLFVPGNFSRIKGRPC